MRCSEIKNELYFYIKDELETGKKTEIENHLKECSGCNILHENFIKLLGDINKNQIEYPRKNWDYFASEILNRIYEKKKFVFWKPALAFCFSLLVFVIGYKHFHQKKLETVAVSSETEELVAYLSNFDIPELYQ